MEYINVSMNMMLPTHTLSREYLNVSMRAERRELAFFCHFLEERKGHFIKLKYL
jgi:hypothetical protein